MGARRQRKPPTPAPPPRRSSARPRALVFGVAIAVAAILVYAQGLSHPFIFDDLGAIALNPQIQDLSDLPALFAPVVETPLAGRPVVALSLAINYALGGLDVRGYRIVNLAVHIACGLLIFLLGRLTLTRLTPRVGSAPDHLALAIALLWTVHPLTSEVVNYVTQRTESLMALCYLGTLYAAVRALGTAHARRWRIAAVVTSAIGMACKESMATAPVMVVLYDRAFVFASFGQAFKARGRFYLSLAATWIVVAVLMLMHTRTGSGGFATAPASPWVYLLNQVVVITHYLRLAIWPDALVLYYGWPRPLDLADVWPYAVPILLLGIGAVVLWLRHVQLGFLALWFFITLAPASSVVPIGSEVGAERRMYLPLMALIALVVIGVAHAWERVAPRTPRPIRAAAVAMIAVTLGVVTVNRTREYSSALTMAQTVLARWPSPVASHMVGTELAREGRLDEAAVHLRKAIDGYPPARYSLGVTLLNQGEMQGAIDQFEQFIRDEPQLESARSARILMGRALEAQGRLGDAIAQYRALLAEDASDYQVHGFLADALSAQGAPEQAIPHYRTFLDGRPHEAEAWTGLAIALASTRQLAPAVTAFRRAVDLQPGNLEFRLNLARSLFDSGDLAGAERDARAALESDPRHPAAAELLARIAAAKKR